MTARQMEVQKLPNVPEGDAIMKANRDVLEGVIGPRQFNVGNADAIAPQLVAQVMLEPNVHDVISAGRDHEDRRHAGVDDVPRGCASIA